MPKSRVPDGHVHELRIALQRTRPPIWRRVAVPSDVTLAELHEVVQIAMGWTDSHLHQFRLKTAAKPLTREEMTRLIQTDRYDEIERRSRCDRVFTDLSMGDMEGEDEGHVALGTLCGKPKDKITYEYDFGDGWEHLITVNKIYPAKDRVRYPVCLGGKLACPPEDCGGTWGYYEMLDILSDPKHPEHAERREWLGGHIDPDNFDRDEVNALLADWRRHPRLRMVGG